MFLALGCVTLPHTYLFLPVLRIEIHMFLCTYLSEWYFIYTVVLILWRCCCFFFFFVSLDAKDGISIGLVISFNCVVALTGANFTWCPALYMVRKVLNPRGLLRLLHSFGEHVLPFSLLFDFWSQDVGASGFNLTLGMLVCALLGMFGGVRQSSGLIGSIHHAWVMWFIIRPQCFHTLEFIAVLIWYFSINKMTRYLNMIKLLSIWYYDYGRAKVNRQSQGQRSFFWLTVPRADIYYAALSIPPNVPNFTPYSCFHCVYPTFRPLVPTIKPLSCNHNILAS